MTDESFPHLPEGMIPGSKNSRSEEFFHGTTEHLKAGDVIRPTHGSRIKPTFPHDSSSHHAYATKHEDNAWSYAEKAFYSRDTGHPRVYQVEPVDRKTVEEDPLTNSGGRLRGNYEGDMRSTKGWRVVSERQMPEHMGKPEDWR